MALSLHLKDSKKKSSLKKVKYSEEKSSDRLSLPADNLFTGERYRTLRNCLLKITSDKATKSFLIASANHGEGKTASVINLAIAITDIEEYQTLIIESDLKHPDIHTRLGLEQSSGLIDILKGRTNLDSAIKDTAKKNLKVLTSGTINSHPGELFEIKKLKNLISEAKAKFDIILLDSPPILRYSDAMNLSSAVDSIVLIVESGKTSKEAIRNVLSNLKKEPNEILGVIFNKHPRQYFNSPKRKH